ncbi:hypothetical protein Ssi03_20750 [Sphaerisporangium siamense]|nr:hypothetical protein Ssi03_20750 [Sphaerisporangium siamense]
MPLEERRRLAQFLTFLTPPGREGVYRSVLRGRRKPLTGGKTPFRCGIRATDVAGFMHSSREGAGEICEEERMWLAT